ncbi:MAG: hypothetical protein DRP66_09065, partial [Planctomycetota bacterium]
MKRAKVILAVCFVILVAVVLSREDGLIRTMFSGADTEVIAGAQESTPADDAAGDNQSASSEAAGDTEAEAGSEDRDDASSSGIGDPNTAAGDPN